jgi:hypothetical protein
VRSRSDRVAALAALIAPPRSAGAMPSIDRAQRAREVK